MSSRKLGLIPKSGEQMLKDALGQFKGIIAQIKEGVKKVQAKVSKNTSELVRLEKENTTLTQAVEEAVVVSANLEKMLSGEIVVLPSVEEASQNEAVDTDKTEDTTSD
jgi:uncharacterized phage infection (PIP) family protein YhgE